MNELLAALLRGDCVPADALERVDSEAFLAAAMQGGVTPLLADRLARRDDVPGSLRARLEEEGRRHAAADLVREAELRACLDALGDAKIPAVVMKGAQLAYSHYPRPDLRPRSDTDLLVPATDVDRIDRLLVEAGYRRLTHATGEFVTAQMTYARYRDDVSVHAVDVHWRIANPQIFSRFLSYDEAAESAVPIPTLHHAARGLSPIHALLVACVHRVAHHYDSDRLIWLYDIHLLASELDAGEWAQFVALANARGVATVCQQSLERTAQCLHTTIPAWPGGSKRTMEPTAEYLDPSRRHVLRVLSDLRALPTWSNRWQLAREHLLPPARYMRDVYAPSSAAPLPFLYLRRVIRGARKWLFRSP